jgi:tRNA-specific 2-thiouridylase
MSGSGRVAVAMSGGLDSSVTAWLLAREGRPVVGLSMLLWDHSGIEAHGRCCGALDLGDARRVAQQAGIPHYTLRMDREFRQHVVDPFIADYLAGRTPSPCVRCNTWIKFDLLLERARRLGAGQVATGHYARILEGSDGPELHTAADAGKDQSYYLFELTREQLAASLFPLGEKSKAEVREIAREAGLVVAEKGESMEVCFVSGGVREFVEAQVASAPDRFAGAAMEQPAALVDSVGNELGAGQPYYRYTVGQRRGLGLAAPSPLYVLAIEPRENRVVVGGGEGAAGPRPLRRAAALDRSRPADGGGGGGEDPLPPPRRALPDPSLGERPGRGRARRAPARGHPRSGGRLLPGHPGPRRLLDRRTGRCSAGCPPLKPDYGLHCLPEVGAARLAGMDRMTFLRVRPRPRCGRSPARPAWW